MGTEVNVNNKNGNGSVWAVVFLILLSGVLGYFAYKYHAKLKEEKQVSAHLEKSLNSSQDTAKTYKVKWENGAKTSAAKVEPLYIKKDNAKKIYPKDLSAAKKMGAVNEDVNSISTASIQTVDSARHVPVYVDSIKSLHSVFNNGWTQAAVTIYRDMKRGADWKIQHTDSIYETNYFKQHHIWFIRWKTKMEMSSITCKNPHSTIKFFRVIKIIK